MKKFFIEKVVPPIVIWGLAYFIFIKLKLAGNFSFPSDWTFLSDFYSLILFFLSSAAATIFIWLIQKFFKENEKESYWLSSRIFEELSSTLVNLSIILMFVLINKDNKIITFAIACGCLALGWITFYISGKLISKYHSTPTPPTPTI